MKFSKINNLLALFIVTISFCISPLLSLADTNTDLLLHWTYDTLDGDNFVIDDSNNVNHGYLKLSGSATTTTAGVYGDAITLDGTNDYIEITDSVSVFDFEKTEAFSYSTWYQSNSQAVTDSFFGNLQSFSGPGVVFGFNIIGGGGCPASFATLGFIVIGAGPTFLYKCTPVNANYVSPGWHHVVLSYDGSRTVEGINIYVDGVLQAEEANSGNSHLQGSSVSTAPMVVGDDRTGDPFDGSFDDTRFYSKALTATNVYELYNNISLPELTTNPASAILSSSATLEAELTSEGAANTTVRGFQYGLTTAYGATTTEEGEFGAEDFSATVTGLDAGTTYHYRAFASSTEGIGYGSDSTFTTLELSAPSVTVEAATSITRTDATLNGSISSDGNASSTERGFVYGTSISYGATSSTSGTYGVGAYTANISSLQCGTTYHIASFATNEISTTYSSDTTFTTSECPSSVSGSKSSKSKNMVTKITPEVVLKPEVKKTNSTFSRHLKTGDTGQDVLELQKFLNSNGYIVSTTGAGSPGMETTYFGSKTRAALVSYQEKNNIYPSVGYFGDITRAKVSN